MLEFSLHRNVRVMRIMPELHCLESKFVKPVEFVKLDDVLFKWVKWVKLDDEFELERVICNEWYVSITTVASDEMPNGL